MSEVIEHNPQTDKPLNMMSVLELRRRGYKWYCQRCSEFFKEYPTEPCCKHPLWEVI